jgi:hypothetical protein
VSRARIGLALGAVLGAWAALTAGAAAEPRDNFKKGGFVVSVEAGGGRQFDLESHREFSDIAFWNVGFRSSLFPVEPFGTGGWAGALEIGLEPLVQRYVEPEGATWAGLAAVGRYHFLGLGTLVPYAELAAAAGGTDLRVREIDSDFAFMLWGGVGASLFVTERTAVYAGYRYQHISNGNTDSPNRGFESHWGVVGFSFYFR